MADADIIRRFVPPYPPRTLGPVSPWRGFFGERARTAVYGWSEAAFGAPYLKRKVLGYTVHIPLQPALVEHVLLDQCRQLCEARHRQETAPAHDRQRSAVVRRRTLA